MHKSDPCRGPGTKLIYEQFLLPMPPLAPKIIMNDTMPNVNSQAQALGIWIFLPREWFPFDWHVKVCLNQAHPRHFHTHFRVCSWSVSFALFAGEVICYKLYSAVNLTTALSQWVLISLLPGGSILWNFLPLYLWRSHPLSLSELWNQDREWISYWTKL